METARPAPVSQAHHAALHRMAQLPNYYEWVFGRLRPWIGSRILDAGGGIGNLTVLVSRWERLALVDINEEQCGEMRERFKGVAGVEVWCQDLQDPGLLRLGREAFDTILCLDVLEHLEAHEQVVAHFRSLLATGGHLLLKVPAHRWLYGTMDRASGHFRRYAKRDIEALARREGFKVVLLSTMNPIAVVPWWVKGKVLKRATNFSLTFSPEELRRMNRAIPWLKLLDRVFPFPVGLSLLAVLQKA
ncbi:MAG: class I SAM-dependent methyltransferase [Nitrospirae bacterium]|nr:MAG: class I SAM-dependent methyltransferase [Nitrospirota bacterium]